MSEGPAAEAAKPEGEKPKAGLLTRILWGAALLGVAAVLYIIVQASSNNAAPTVATVPLPDKTAFATKVTTPAEPTPAPAYTFYDSEGKPRTIADFKGKVVVMNIWATWCAPCKIEMPTLAKLAAAYKGQPVEIVTISIDSPEAATKARLFIAQNAPLAFYHDRDMKLPFKVNAPGAPTTIIYGKDGMESSRVAGEADWNGPEAKALIDKALAAG